MHNDAIEALYTDAQTYPGGIGALARMIGRPARGLEMRLSGLSQEDLSDREADALAHLIYSGAEQNRYIETKCRRHHGAYIPLPVIVGEDAGAIEEALADTLDLARAQGRVLNEKALAALRGASLCVMESLYRLLIDIDEGRIKPLEELAPVMPLRSLLRPGSRR